MSEVETLEATAAPAAKPNPSATEVDLLINRHVLGAMGIGMVPVPIVDLVGVGALQFTMIRKMAALYDVEASDARVRSVVMSLFGGAVPALGALPLFSLVQAIPVIGWTVGASASSILSGASTYAVGQIMRRHFEAGGTIEDFSLESSKEALKDLVKKGKSVAKSLGRSRNADADDASVS